MRRFSAPNWQTNENSRWHVICETSAVPIPELHVNETPDSPMDLVISLATVADRLDPAIGNFLSHFRDEHIPIELSVAILAGAALLFAGVIIYGGLAVTRIHGLRRLIRADGTPEAFAANFPAIDQRLSASVFRDSWSEYRKCLRHSEGAILALRRPDEFLGLHAMPSKFFPARFFAAAHSYFIGIGLILTFIGLVAALKFAATGVASTDIGVARDALDGLLAAAAFKFMTSIAGLCSSLTLSIASRSATYAVESAALGLARDLEHVTQPIFSESVAYDQLAATRVQLGQLERIESRLRKLTVPSVPALDGGAQSHPALRETLASLLAEIQGTAGGAMTQLVGKLSDVGGVIGAMQTHIGRSGEQFAGQMERAASQLIAATEKLQEKLDSRSNAAAARLESRIESLATVLARGEKQFAGAADKAASALAINAGELDMSLRAQLGAMREIVTSLDRTRAALGETASTWTQCTAPVVASVEASRQIAVELGKVTHKVGTAQHDMADMAKAIAQLSDRIGVVWDNYRSRFEKVDGELQAVFERLQGGTRAFGEEVMDFVGKLDTSLANGMQALSLGTEELRDVAQMFVIHGGAKAA